jgi:osmoprotectant transport system permease protein
MASVADKTGTTLVAMGAPVEGRRARRRSSWGYLFMPLLITAALVGLYLIGQNRTYSTGERRRLNAANIRTDTWEHVELTVVSTVLVLLIAIPLGVLLTRTFATLITPPILAVFNI